EPPIDLEPVESQLVQVIKAGISGSEIVDRDANARTTKCLYGVARRLQVLNKSAFGNLHLETVRRQPGFVHDGQDRVGEPSIAQLRGRKVERQRKVGRPGYRIAAGVAEELTRKRVQQAELLRKRDENARQYQAAYRIMPARQALKTDNPPGFEVNDGLIVRSN